MLLPSFSCHRLWRISWQENEGRRMRERLVCHFRFSLFSVEWELARSTKFQAPSSKEAPSPQIPNPLLHSRALPNPGVPTAPERVLARPCKGRRGFRLTTPARGARRALELGTWSFFGVWSLGFGAFPASPSFFCLHSLAMSLGASAGKRMKGEEWNRPCHAGFFLPLYFCQRFAASWSGSSRRSEPVGHANSISHPEVRPLAKN